MTSPIAFAQESGVSPKAYETVEALPERVRLVATLRGLGYSYREIGRLFSVTPQAVSVMLGRHKRVMRNLSSCTEMQHLSARAVNALGRHKIRTREEARRANVQDLLARERNCGRKTLDEIKEWMAADADGASDIDTQSTARVVATA